MNHFLVVFLIAIMIPPALKALEAQRDERRSLVDAQDKVDGQREELIADIEGKLTRRAKLATLFTLRWRLQ